MLLRKTSVLLICILWGSDTLVVKFSMASPTVGADSERMSSAGCHESKTVIPVRLQKISADQTSATTDLNTAIQGRRTAGEIPMRMERLSLQVDVWNITYILDVKLNTDLISANYTERFFDQSGRLRKRKVTEHCYYHGQVRGRRVSVVAISTCRGLKGMFRIDEQTFSIMPLEPKDGVHPHLLCNWQKLRSKDMVAPEDENILRSKRVSKLDASNRIRKGIRRDRDFMELMLVNDFSMYQMYGQDLDKVNEYTISAVNILGELYRAQLNTRIVLVATETWTSGNRITVKKDIGETLVNFLDYQYPEVRGQIPRYPAQLITRTSFEEGNSDKTRQDRLCSGIESAGVNTDFGNGSPLFLATTLANHIGLNIGLSNDNRRSCNCPGSIGCINGVISGSYPVVFSSCSVEDHNLFMNNGHGRCVLDVPDDATRRDTHVHNFAAPICGNGVVESGEECDCGTDEECTGNSCCSTDCMFTPGAVCAHGECCKNCKFKASGELCRTATGDCDVGEVCTGTDGQCPTDKHKRDGISCSNEKAYCFGGTCQTRDRQCTVLWGEGSRASEDICYERLNIIGNSSGNCGKDGDRWIPCASEDVFCGYLFCNGDTSDLKVGKMLAYTSEEFNRNGHIIECKGWQIFREDGFPLGYVNDGTICGDGKVCLGNKCTTVTRLNTLGNIMVREKHGYARTEAFPQKTNRLRNTNVHSFHSSHSTRVNDGNSRTDVPKNPALTERNATEQRCATTTQTSEPVFTKDRDLNPGRDTGNVARNFVVGRKRGEVATLRKLLGTSTETDTGMEEMITTNTTIGESVNTTGKIGYNLTLEGTSAPLPENRQESTTERTVSGGATLGSNTIIGTVIACVFLVAVVFGATSIGFKKVKRRRSLMQARRQHPYFISLGGRPICRQPLGGKPRKKKQYRRGEKHDNTRPYRDVKTKKLRSPAADQPFHDGDDIVAVESNLSTSTTSKVTHTLHSADTTV